MPAKPVAGADCGASARSAEAVIRSQPGGHPGVVPGAVKIAGTGGEPRSRRVRNTRVFAVTRVTGVDPADRETRGTHVGVVGCGPSLTSLQCAELGRALAIIRLNRQGPLTLHHGCSPGADEAAHRIVRKLGGGWRIHGHPAHDSGRGFAGRTKGIMRDLDVVHASKPHEERDADIVSASGILVAIPPYPEDDPRSSQSETWTMIRMGRAAGREIVYVPRPRGQDEPGSRKAVRTQTGVTAADARQPARAKASHTCRRCRKPVSDSRERWGWLCEDCERPLIPVSRPGDSSYRVPDANSVHAVPAGLPGLGKRR